MRPTAWLFAAAVGASTGALVLATPAMSAMAAVSATPAMPAMSAGATAASSAACRPAIRDLGEPFGGRLSFADGVNSRGEVAGSALLRNGRGRAVTWDGGSVTDLGVVAPYDESYAHGINDAGTVVGELDRKQTYAAPFVAVNGHMRVLPGLGGDFGSATDINRLGTISGVAADRTGQPHAVVWTDDGTKIHDLGIAPGDAASFGNGLNNANVVVGDSDTASGDEHPAVFDHGVGLLRTTRSRQGAAEDVSSSGRIVGLSFLPGGEQHATVWGSTRTVGRDLGTLPGGTRAALENVDDEGRAVGGGDLARDPDLTHAIVWPGHGPLRSLQPLSGHLRRDFAVAREIGPDGEVVGGSQDSAGDIHATVWTCAFDQAVDPAGLPAAPFGRALADLPAALSRADRG